jgi:low temperature requirement protein LtrA
MVKPRQAQRRGRVLGGVRSTSEDHRATPFELFFDLVYVFAMTQVTGYMAHEHSAQGVLQGLLLLTLLWWTWSGYAWLGNQARADEGLLRAGMAVAMAAMFVVALTIPEAWHDAPGGLNGPLVLVWAYLLVRCVHLTLYAVAATGDPGLRRQVAITWLPTVAGAALLVAGALLGDGPRRCCLPVPCWWRGSASISPPGMATGGCAAWPT